MAAMTSALRVLTRPGTTLVVPSDGYYQVRRFAAESLAPQGVTVIEASAAQMCDAAAGADVVLAETPVNPTLDVVDLHRLAMICRGRGATLVVDNTTPTPLGQQPLSLGADLVVASATKGLSGHSDLVAGYVAGSHPELMAAVERERLVSGAILGPFEAWLALRSLGTAGLRFERQCKNAQAVALMLRGHPAVRSVRYPGLPDDPAHDVACRQMKHFGGVVSVELADAATAHELVERSACWSRPPASGASTRRSTGGHAGAIRSPTAFARISLGIEDTDDLLADIERALGRADGLRPDCDSGHHLHRSGNVGGLRAHRALRPHRRRAGRQRRDRAARHPVIGAQARRAR